MAGHVELQSPERRFSNLFGEEQAPPIDQKFGRPYNMTRELMDGVLNHDTGRWKSIWADLCGRSRWLANVVSSVLCRNTKSYRTMQKIVSLSWFLLRVVRILVISTTKRCKLIADVHWIITTRGFTRVGSLGYPASRGPTFSAIACEATSITPRQSTVVAAASSSFSQSLSWRL